MYLRRKALAAVGGAVLAAGVVAGSGGAALADYGPGAVYQIEISANQNSPQGGGGAWLWIERGISWEVRNRGCQPFAESTG